MDTEPVENPPATYSALQWANWIDEHAPDIGATLRHAAKMSATDVHFRSGHKPWLKIGGTFEPIDDADETAAAQLIAAIQWVGGEDVSRTVLYPIGGRQRWRG